MLWANGRFPSLRPLAPALLVLGMPALALLAIVSGIWWPLATIAAAWLSWLAVVGFRSPTSTAGVMTAAAIMHLSYGLGLIWGLVRGPGPVRRMMKQ
jgi:hypothetical protein